jgi:hypothetical protein
MHVVVECAARCIALDEVRLEMVVETSLLVRMPDGTVKSAVVEPHSGLVLVKCKTMHVAPNVVLNVFSKHAVESLEVSSIAHTENMCYEHYQGGPLTLQFKRGTKHAFLTTSIDVSCDESMLLHETNEAVRQCIVESYSLGACPRTMHDFVQQDLVIKLFMSSARAYDAHNVSGERYVFTTKVDGERMWMVQAGSVWLFVRRLLGGSIVAWELLESIQRMHVSMPVYDVEIVIGLKPVFIDTLVNSYGEVLSTNHTLSEAVAAFNCDSEAMRAIHIRQYFGGRDDAEKYTKASSYPSDGVVAISVNDRVTWKLKEVRAIELRVSGGGELVTEDGFVAAVVSTDHGYKVGDIVEVRFKQGSRRMKVTSIFPRPDKAKANDRAACVAVISCMNASYHSDASIRMAVVSWSRSVTSYIVTEAVRAASGRIIIDVGSSIGMAVSDYTSCRPSPPVLFVEPDAERYKKLLANIGSRDALDASRANEAILKLMSGSRSSIGRFKAVNCTIEEMLGDSETLRTVIMHCGAVVFSFSISHTVGTLNMLCRSGVKVLGCGYFYDGMRSDGVLIEDYGVSMKIGECGATVRWGSDEAYTEQAVRLSSFDSKLHAVAALDVVPMQHSDYTDECVSIARHVKILM